MTDAADEILITHNAAQRYCERVDQSLSLLEAISAIRRHAHAIEVAADFGCSTVKIGNGARLLLCGRSVITVLGRFQIPPKHRSAIE